jgi:opacity protein-like surface antigen
MVAVEAQFITANDATEPDPFANSFKMTTGPIAALYGRISVPLSDQVGVYGMVGLAQTKTEYQAMSPPGPANSDKATRLSFGLGIDVKLTEQLRASADLMFYRHGDVEYPAYFTGGSPKQNVSALGFGLNYRF